MRNIVSKNLLLFILILAAIFLRFYRLPEFATFLGDQGRDAIIIKRIITFEHFPAIGAPSSLGQIYLGPFYYYLMAPFLLLFRFNPEGLAYGVALISITGLILSFLILKKEFGLSTALFFLIFLTFSFANIQLSRFSWNPNLLPVFSFFTLYFFYKNLKSENLIYPILFGAFFSFTIQLHYLGVLLGIPILVILIINRKVVLKKMALSFLTFVIFTSPLIIFDLRHQFLNTKNFIKLFTDKNILGNSSFLSRFLETIQALIFHTFQFNVNVYLALLLFSLITISYILLFWKKNNLFLNINFLNLFFYILFFSLLNTLRHVHYYGPVFFSLFLLLSCLITYLKKNKFLKFTLIVLIFGFYLSGNIRNLTYLFNPAENQIKGAKTIALSIITDKPVTPYQVVALPYVETDGHIRYFLELNGIRPLPEDTLSYPIQLYVLCFDKDCPVLGNPQWQIASFKNGVIDKIWTVNGVKIYKLVHNHASNISYNSLL